MQNCKEYIWKIYILQSTVHLSIFAKKSEGISVNVTILDTEFQHACRYTDIMLFKDALPSDQIM
jgi:hypothetical protein